MTIALVDSSRPTVSRGKLISPTRALTTVVRLPAIPGRWPLIVFAHGFKVGPDPYAQLCATWAAAGYVVAAPEFPLTDLAVAGPSLDENDLVNQPGDMRFVVTSLLAAGGAVAGQIQPGRLGVAGHSDGAETALATAADSALGAKAVIVMSGSPLGPSSSPGPMVNPPMLVIQGDHDTINAPNEGQAVYDSASPPRFLLHLLGADHLTPFAGPSPWQPIIRDTTLDFLDQYLTGNLPAGRELSDDARAGLATLESTP